MLGEFLTLNAALGQAELPSFAAVYERYFDFIWSMTRRFGIREDAIDDVVQEILVVIHSKLHTVENPDSLRSWIYAVVRKTASSYRRRGGGAQNEVRELAEDVPAVDMTSPEDLTQQSEQVQRLWRLLETLSPEKREVFIMSELEGFTCPEIAEALSIPLNTAYSRRRTGREAFDLALERENERSREQS
jgi:RNA polymerase sigma-70 factor, ECF subfamily